MGGPTFSIPLSRAAAWCGESLPGAPFLDLASGPPDLAFIEPLLRRRLSPMGRAMLHCAGRVAGQGPLRAVFASRHGEPARTLPILADLAQGLEPSPTQFSMNVHNAIAGIWSIARKDRSPAIALAAGPATFGWGLVEAFAQLRTHGGPLLFVYGDDALPEPLAAFEALQAPLHAVALLLDEGAPHRLEVDWEPGDENPASPDVQSLHFLRALGAQAGPWRGPGGAWSWRLDP